MTHFMNDCKFTEKRSTSDGEIYTICTGEKGEKIFDVRGTYDAAQRLQIFSAIIKGYDVGCRDGADTERSNIRNALGI